MKLTDEQRAALDAAMPKRMVWANSTDRDAAAFLAGARWMRERAAQEVEADFWNIDNSHLAAAIRAVPLGDDS